MASLQVAVLRLRDDVHCHVSAVAVPPAVDVRVPVLSHLDNALPLIVDTVGFLFVIDFAILLIVQALWVVLGLLVYVILRALRVKLHQRQWDVDHHRIVFEARLGQLLTIELARFLLVTNLSVPRPVGHHFAVAQKDDLAGSFLTIFLAVWIREVVDEDLGARDPAHRGLLIYVVEVGRGPRVALAALRVDQEAQIVLLDQRGHGIHKINIVVVLHFVVAVEDVVIQIRVLVNAARQAVLVRRTGKLAVLILAIESEDLEVQVSRCDVFIALK